MTQEENISFALPSSITIENVEAVVGEIKQLNFDAKKPFVLDASRLGCITTPGVQLLISLHKTLSQAGGKLVVKNTSDALIQPMQMLGLQNYLIGWSES